jgi:hypothetical protein
MWGTTVVDSSFEGADLRGSALGGVEGSKRNAFLRVKFAKADLRKTVYVSCDMTGCGFADANLSQVDFQGAVFVDCVFEGELSEVTFNRLAFRGDMFPANEMRGVDFRRAELRGVEFRGLNMDDVVWPESRDHVVVSNYRAALERALIELNGHEDVPSRRLSAVLGMMRKWAGPSQRCGVVNKKDLLDAGGAETTERLLRLLEAGQN